MLHRAAVALLLASLATGQCQPAWTSTGSLPGADLGVYATTLWDPDGNGPAAPRLVAAGSFATIGGTSARAVASWDAATGQWSSLPGLTSGDGLAACGLPNGDLVVGGWLQGVGGAGRHLARWDGSQWQPLGGDVNGLVYALAALPNGDLVAAGMFTQAGGAPASRIARWNGSQWQPLGSGLSATVYALLVLPNGDLLAGGAFTTAGGVAAAGVARWDGAAWHSLGASMGPVQALRRLANGDVVAAGAGLQRWDGSQWHGYNLTSDGDLTAVAELPNGDLVVGGGFRTVNGAAASLIARFDGATWSALGAPGLEGTSSPVCWTLQTLPNGDLVAGGRFLAAGGRPAFHVARWNGSWQPFGTGLDAEVQALAARPGGGFVAGGRFTAAGGQALRHVGAYDGATWSPLGAGMQWPTRAIAAHPNGDFVVVGYSQAFPGSSVAIWRQGAWLPMGAGIPGDARCAAVLGNGDVVVGGLFNWAGTAVANIARWDGSSWHPLGNGLDNRVNALAVLPNGDLVAGGLFTGNAARWDGSQWTPLGNPGTEILALAALPGGDVVAGGHLAGGAARTLQRWNGSAWQSLGSANQSVLALAHHPSGALFAGGAFTFVSGQSTGNLAMYDGTSWHGFADLSGGVLALAVLADGSLAVGGGFRTVGALVSPHVAILQLPCPGSAVPTATACVGPAGPLQLSTDRPAWLRANWRSTVTGLAPGAAVAMATGLATASVPLAQLHPFGLPQCDQLVSLDAVVLLAASGGATSHSIALPPTATLLGVVFHQQALQAHAGGASQPPSLSSSNRLTVTIGSL